MKQVVIVFAATVCLASAWAPAREGTLVSAPAQEGASCVGLLPISQLIVDALPETQRNEGHGYGGFANNQHHSPIPVPEGQPRLEEPQYPVHTLLEFRFQSDIDDPDAFRNRACSAVQEALVATCGSVESRTLVRTCSFRTSDNGRTGTVDILPDSRTASARMLIVVASEW